MPSATRTQSPAPRQETKEKSEKTYNCNRAKARKRLPFFSYVSDDGIRKVASFKFVAGTYTTVDNLMNPFWIKCQTFVPRWISPNAVTLFGGFCATLSTLIAVYAHSLQRWWLYCLSSLLFLGYQTADAVDGKHARATGQSTPLGSIVDHGLDAFVALLTALSVTSVVEPRLESWAILCGFNGFLSVWFAAQWEHLEGGVLETVGITEMEFLVATLLVLPAVLGEDMFSLSVSLPWRAAELREITALTIGIGCSIGTVVTIGRVLMKTRRLRSLVSLIPMLLHNVISVALFPREPARATPLLTMTVIGMDACILMTKMVLSSITHSPWPLVHFDAIPFALVTILVGAGLLIPSWVLLILLAWQTLTFVLLWEDTIRRICAELGIPFISQVPRKDS